MQGTTKVAHAIPTTLMYYPSTDFVAKGNLHFNTSLYSKDLNNSSFISEGLTYGVGPEKDGPGGRTELGLDYISGGSGLDLDTTSTFGSISFGKRIWLNGKTQLWNSDPEKARVVAGFWGVGSKGSDITGSTLPPDAIYLLGSKAFDFGRIHVGVEHMLQKSTFSDGAPLVGVFNPNSGTVDSAQRTALQLGFDKESKDGKWEFAADAWTGKSAYSVISPSVLYLFSGGNADFQLGYVHFNDSNVFPGRSQIYVGFDYTWDLSKK